MQLIATLDAIDPAQFAGGTAVAIGKFDGLHRGHLAILDALQRRATPEALHTVIFTFTNNPLSVLRPELCPSPLTTPEQRADLIAAEGIDTCVMVEFDEELSKTSAEDFVVDVLVRKLNVKHVVLGADFRFGYRGVGDGELLSALGAEHGFEVEVVACVADSEAGGEISSSRIRDAVLTGDVRAAASMLGRPYSVRGEVVRGDARGRELGYPTANLGGVVEGLIPAHGVYAGAVVIDGVRRAAAISVGVNLTFEPEGEPRVEAYVLDFDGDLYGTAIEVQFTERLRPMLPFETVDALVEQMREDVSATRRLEA